MLSKVGHLIVSVAHFNKRVESTVLKEKKMKEIKSSFLRMAVRCFFIFSLSFLSFFTLIKIVYVVKSRLNFALFLFFFSAAIY